MIPAWAALTAGPLLVRGQATIHNWNSINPKSNIVLPYSTTISVCSTFKIMITSYFCCFCFVIFLLCYTGLNSFFNHCCFLCVANYFDAGVYCRTMYLYWTWEREVKVGGLEMVLVASLISSVTTTMWHCSHRHHHHKQLLHQAGSLPQWLLDASSHMSTLRYCMPVYSVCLWWVQIYALWFITAEVAQFMSNKYDVLRFYSRTYWTIL